MDLLFNITMGTGFALSIDPNNNKAGGQLILYENSNTEYQQWTWVSYPLTDGNILYNPSTNLYAAPVSLAQGAPVILFDDFTFSPNNTWNFGVVSSGFVGVRPVAQTKLNLNATGGSGWGNGTKIIIWGWGGGQPNEIWNSTMVGNWRIAELTNNTGGKVYWGDLEPIPTTRGPAGSSYTLIAEECSGFIQITDIGATGGPSGVSLNGSTWLYNYPGEMQLTINKDGSFSAEGGVSSAGGNVIPLNPIAWMSDLGTLIGPQMLRQVALPGTHDSATYGITPGSGFANDNASSWLDIFYLTGLLGAAITYTIAPWCKAQNQTITEQLEGGIRYLDLRVEPRGDTPWIVHTMWSVPVSDVLTQVNDFITQNPKEIVLLDFNHFYDMTPSIHAALAASIISTFDKKLAPNSLGNDVTINDLWNGNYQVIVFYDDAETVKAANLNLWPESAISSPWPQTSDLTTLQTTLGSELPNNRGTFFVLQGILTPNASMVTAGALHTVSNPFSSLSKLAQMVTPAVNNWIQYEWSTSGLNIVIVDVYENAPIVLTLRANNIAAAAMS